MIKTVDVDRYRTVSIRSRLFSREILDKLREEAETYGLFQSAPGFLAGRYGLADLLRNINAGFNPLPAF